MLNSSSDKVDLTTSHDSMATRGHRGAGKLTAACTLEVETEPYQEDLWACNTIERFQINLGKIKMLDGSGTQMYNTKMVIDWGDGRSRSYPVYDFLGIVGTTYGSAGTYEIKILGFENELATTACASKTFSVRVPNTCYHGVGGEQTVWKYRDDTYRAIRCSASVLFKHVFGAPPDRFKCTTRAVTEAFHWEKNFLGHWTWREYNKAKRLVAEYSIQWTKDDAACTPTYSDTASTWPWDVQEAEVQQSGEGKRNWQKMTSHHEMWTDDGKPPVTLDLVTYPCM